MAAATGFSTLRVGTGITPLIMGDGNVRAASRFSSLGEAELDFLAIADHITFRTGIGIDGLLNAAAMLAWQPRLPVQVGVYLLAARHPTLVARQLIDIERLHPGRLTFAVGVGGEDRSEFLACGVDPATRGKRTDEALDIVRALLTRQNVTYEGAHFRIEDVTLEPRPHQPPPLLIGGRSDHALRRTARVGDGWQALWVSPARFRQATAQIAELAESFGRPDVRWQHGLNVWCDVDPDPRRARDRLAATLQKYYGLPFEKFERWSPAGTPGQVADFLAEYIAAGCTSVNLTLPGESFEQSLSGAEAIRAALRESSGS
jgi:alkanesulfonate monooxygenase SsuD/methylene tetrahydromethanopterin reductase-like flavin-dependent oxidoreductase (luciferase family)